jgi:hypothetical protein
MLYKETHYHQKALAQCQKVTSKISSTTNAVLKIQQQAKPAFSFLRMFKPIMRKTYALAFLAGTTISVKYLWQQLKV